MPETWSLDRARAFWAHRQCLTAQARTPVEAATRGGWPRTLGGIEPYLAIAARCGTATQAGIEQAVESGELRVTPAVRGCIYLVPRAHEAVALAISEEQARPRLGREITKAGATLEELAAVGDAVVDALSGGPLSTDAVRAALPDAVVRSLGEAGKKVGITSTLPPALRLLEWDGRIERTLKDGRVDTERYFWRLRDDRPEAPRGAALHADLTRIFLGQAGPATLDELVAWSGLTKRDAKAAIAALEAVPVRIEGWAEAWLLPEDSGAEAPSGTAEARLLPMEDLATVWRGGPGVLTDPRHHHIPLRPWGMGTEQPLGKIAHTAQRLILLDHMVRGRWEWDAEHDRVAWQTFDAATPEQTDAIETEAARVAVIIRSLGNATIFRMDKPELVAERAKKLRR